MLYSDSFPEAHGNEESTKEHALSLQITKSTLKWPWIVMAFIVAAAIAIGVGVETWRHREHSSHKSFKILRCEVPIGRASSWLTILARRRRKILIPHVSHNLSSTIHVWQRSLFPMAIDSYFFRTTLVSFDMRLHPSLISPEGYTATLPNNIFPFARLASVTLADESTTFLYHQMNGTTFAEEQWDASENAWVGTEYITISNS